MLAAMLTFQDHSDALRVATASGSSTSAPSRHNSDGPQTPSKTPSEIVSALQTINKVCDRLYLEQSLTLSKADRNDVIVGEQGSIEDYANHCVQMLKVF